MPDTSGQPGGEVGAAGLDYIAEPLRPLAVPIGELNADPANARRHPDHNLAAIEASLRRWGQRFPIVVQRQGMVVRAGNGRLEAARRLGWTHLAAVVVDEDSVEATAFALADNRSAELAEWDDEALAALLQSLPTDVPTGFSEGDLEALLAGLNPVEVVEDEPPEVEAVVVSRTGDLWLCGEHRVLCGDSTVAEDVERVMGGERADATLSDPPYGIGLDYESHDDTPDELQSLIDGFLPLARERSDCVLLTTGISNHRMYPRPDWMLCWFYGVGPFRCPWGFHVWQPVLAYGTDPFLRRGLGCRPDAIHMVGGDTGETGHPCPKPIKVWCTLMERCSVNRGDSIYDPFLGSGTTVIAAEQLGRKCYGIEIAPKYVDVIVRRWQNRTGKAATLDGDGRTFDAVAAERAEPC